MNTDAWEQVFKIERHRIEKLVELKKKEGKWTEVRDAYQSLLETQCALFSTNFHLIYHSLETLFS